MAAVKSQSSSLKFALGGLNQDKSCLIQAGLWDEDYIDRTDIKESDSSTKKRRIVLSTRFSLSAESSEHATKFTVELKNHPCINREGYVVYSPNAFNKGTCDPNWTDKEWPCRGTYDSCKKPHLLKTGVPQEHECCWRYSFRCQLEEAHRSGGFMIQAVDCDRPSGMLSGPCGEHILGDGQKIKTEMAQDVGIKVFQYYEHPPLWPNNIRIDGLVSKIEEWHSGGRSSVELCECRFRNGDPFPFETALRTARYY